MSRSDVVRGSGASDDLIREARAFVDRVGPRRDSDLVARLADALEAAESRATEAEAEMHARELHHFEVEQELVAALAVIEKARSLHYPHENPIHTEPALVCAHRHCVDDAGDQVAWPCPTGRTLSSVPADVLRERDAEKWDQGAKVAYPIQPRPDWANAPDSPYRTEGFSADMHAIDESEKW